MGRIAVLDRNMINMIAAGEVIERPASVVKELVENSIDAGATKITVAIEDGGKNLISVADNGCGMDAEDLARAFEPHATSKIRTSGDLQHISTLGFRGEALASIASVAQLKAVSRIKDSPGGNCIEIDCGNKSDVRPCSADCGTTIEVRDIFYKLPVRRKFLRTANTEAGHITEHFTRIALARNDLDMTLFNNGREIFRLSANSGLHQRIAQLFSDEISGNLVETESTEKGLHIFALLGKPAISRTSGSFQYIFLNGRFIRDKFISHAIKEAYRGSLEPNRFPVVFLFIRMPYEDYDVNVHPTKIEVRFYNSNLVHSQILSCLRQKLLGANLDVTAKLPPAADSTGPRSRQITDAMTDFFKKHRPAQTQQQLGFRHSSRPAESYEKTADQRSKFLQIHDSFIAAEDQDGFILVDQHALHERILYEKLCSRLQTGKLESQKLLLPQTFELTDAAAATLKANAALIEKLGIELTDFGPKTVAIQSFPSLLAKAEPVGFVKDLTDLLVDKVAGCDAEALLKEVLSMAACKAAVKAGQALTDSEIEKLLADRQIIEQPSRCPHGRPTTIRFSIAELQKQFKRT